MREFLKNASNLFVRFEKNIVNLYEIGVPKVIRGFK